jgi:hypothetical protein
VIRSCGNDAGFSPSEFECSVLGDIAASCKCSNGPFFASRWGVGGGGERKGKGRGRMLARRGGHARREGENR